MTQQHFTQHTRADMQEKAELKSILAKIQTIDIVSGGYSPGHYIERNRQPLGGNTLDRGGFVDIEDLLEAFGFNDWQTLDEQ